MSALLNDPRDVRAINHLAREWAAAEGRTTIEPVAFAAVVIEEDAGAALADITRDLARGGPVVVVDDHTPKRRGAESVTDWVLRWVGTAAPVRRLAWPASGGALHADDSTAAALSPHLADAAAVVVVGSGSVTDVVKSACHRLPRRMPLIAVPTAASVTAYTSSLAVLTADGVKRTRPTRAPDAVVCDLTLLRDAPPSLTRAGYGDVLARAVSGGDWWLADRLGMSERFSTVPMRLLEPHERALLEQPEAVLTSGLRTLIEALLLAGMAMTLVDHTAPLSGWEHVISHYLDLRAGLSGGSAAWHGAQVGAGTLVAARAYAALKEEPAWWGRLADAAGGCSAWHQAIDDHFGVWDVTGRVRAELHRDITVKLDSWRDTAHRRRAALADGAWIETLHTVVRPPHVLEEALRRAGAATTFADLQPPVGREAAAAAVQHAHLLRARFTLGDVLVLSGWLTPERSSAVLAAADV